jgi:hypothetical protein
MRKLSMIAVVGVAVMLLAVSGVANATNNRRNEDRTIICT